MIDLQKIHSRVDGALQQAGASPWLLGYDINEIQQLVTASSRPITMRGASQVIKDFDEGCRHSPLSIFAGGGRGVELAASEQAAHERLRELVTGFRGQSCGGVLAAAAVPWRSDLPKASLAWLRRRLDNAKDAAPPLGGSLAADKPTLCEDCCALAGAVTIELSDGARRICARCDRFRRSGQKFSEASETLLNFASHRRIAAISADGNNLGAFFASLTSLHELAIASEAIAEIFGAAHQAALQTTAPAKALSPVTGGDDLRVFLAPQHVLPYVEALARGVERGAEAAQRALGRSLSAPSTERLARVGVGVGAVVAGDHYPAARLIAAAHERERAAKGACAPVDGSGDARTKARSAFDFAILTSDSFDEGDRPPALDLEADAWAQAMRSSRALRQVPTSQRALLAERDQLSKDEFDNLLCYQVARSTPWQAWFDACNVDWRDRAALCAHARTARVDLLDLLGDAAGSAS